MQVLSFIHRALWRPALGLVAFAFALAISAIEARAQETQPPSALNDDLDRNQTIAVLFEYSAPSVCPNDDRVFSLVHRRSERVVRVNEASAPQRLIMEISLYPQGYRGELTVLRIGQSKERRSMKGSTCSEVVEALALTAALSIDPNATLTLGPLSEGDPGETSADADPERAAQDGSGDGSSKQQKQIVADADDANSSSTKKNKQTREPTHRMGLGLALSLQKVMDKSVHVGGGVAFSVSQPGRTWFPLELRGLAQLLLDTASSVQPGIRTHLWLFNMAYCPLRLGVDLAVLFCPVAQLGAIVAKSEGLQVDSSTTRFFAAVGAQVELRSQVSEHMDLWFTPALLFPLTQREFAIDPGPEVVRSTVFPGWNATFGANWAF